VEEFLRVKSSTKKQRQVPVGRSDDVRKDVDGLGTAEGILVRKFVLGAVSGDDLLAETFGDAGK